MLRLLGTIPRRVVVALSGGVDSMVAIDFLRANHDVSAAFFHHGTSSSALALPLVEAWCRRYAITLHLGVIRGGRKPDGLSHEEWWRTERYAFLDRFDTVVTGHHLDDAVETWIWSSLHGTSKLLPHRRGNVIRPFILNKKDKLVEWATRKGVPWVDDSSNGDTKYTRNYIRHELVPHALRVNPGLHKTIAKKIEDRYQC